MPDTEEKDDNYTVGIIAKDADGNLYALTDQNKLPNVPETMTTVSDVIIGERHHVDNEIQRLVNGDSEDVASKYICDRIN